MYRNIPCWFGNYQRDLDKIEFQLVVVSLAKANSNCTISYISGRTSDLQILCLRTKQSEVRTVLGDTNLGKKIARFGYFYLQNFRKISDRIILLIDIPCLKSKKI